MEHDGNKSDNIRGKANQADFLFGSTNVNLVTQADFVVEYLTL